MLDNREKILRECRLSLACRRVLCWRSLSDIFSLGGRQSSHIDALKKSKWRRVDRPRCSHHSPPGTDGTGRGTEASILARLRRWLPTPSPLRARSSS